MAPPQRSEPGIRSALTLGIDMAKQKNVENDTIDEPIPLLWRKRERLMPLLEAYGARVLGSALAQRFDLEQSRTSCHMLAALMMALTNFDETYDYLDFYVSLAAEDPAVVSCLHDLQGISGIDR